MSYSKSHAITLQDSDSISLEFSRIIFISLLTCVTDIYLDSEEVGKYRVINFFGAFLT